MPCLTQEPQQLTPSALSILCNSPLTNTNFLTPLGTDLDNIREQSFMDNGSSCSRLIAPDFASGSNTVALNITNTNVTTATLASVTYASRILISGQVFMSFTGGAATSEVSFQLSTVNYIGIGGVSFYTGKINKTKTGAYTDSKSISWVLNVAANTNPSIFITATGSAASLGNITGSIQIIRIHQ